MTLEFRPPQDLINAYLSRPSPGEIASKGIQDAMQTYVAEKDAKQKEALAQQAKDIEMAKGLAGNGQDFMDAYNKVVATRTPQPNAQATPTAQAPSLIDRAKAFFGGTQAGKTPNQTQAPASDPYASMPGMQPPTPSTGTVSGISPTPTTPGLVSSPTTDPLIQEYQKDPIAFKQQHGTNGMTKLKSQAELDKMLTEKPTDKFYTTDQSTKLLKNNPDAAEMIGSFPKDQVPRDAVHLMMTTGKQDMSLGTKESQQQDKLEEQYRKSFQQIRGDPALKRVEEQRDAAAIVYNRIKEVKDHGQVLNPVDYVDMLGQAYKARTGTAPTNEVLEQARQATAKGNYGKAYTFFTGQQAPATTESIMQSLQDMALSMGTQADKFHDGYMRSRMRPPKGLAHDRVENVKAERGMSFAEATGYQPPSGAGAGGWSYVGKVTK